MRVGESGSTLRFLLPVVGALGVECDFVMEGRLSERPVEGLLNALSARGMSFEREGSVLKASGKLVSGDFVTEANVSSQYVSGLLFALPLLDGDSRLILEGERVSASYIELTLSVLDDFGIKTERTESGFDVKGNQRYVLPKDTSAEGDWSAACFLIAAGLLAGETRVFGLKEDSLQADRAFADMMREAGGDVRFENGVCVAKKSELHGICVDGSACPDALPMLAIALAFAKGTSLVKGVERLRFKESDRLAQILNLLSAMKVDCRLDGGLLIEGGHPSCGEFLSAGDHRIAMSAIVAALALDGESGVGGVECIGKSYPRFLEDMAKLGGHIRFSEEK